MSKVKTNDKVGDLVRWASDLAEKYEVNTLTVLVQFRKLKSAGASIEEAKTDIEEVYAS